MSNIIEEKLKTIRSNILDGKNELSQALHMCGLDTVKPNDDFPHNQNSENYETFIQYANYIKRLATKNSFIMQFRINEEAQTVYKRTIVLPMLESAFGNSMSLNKIADELINSDEGVYPVTLPYMPDETEHVELGEEYYTYDIYGNKCLKGDIEIPQDNTSSELSLSDYPMPLDITPNYEYEVDWGDGSIEKYVNGETYENNKKAIWHTYEKPGVYDVSINGIFRIVKTYGDDQSSYVKDGEYVKDKDGTTIINQNNYGMRNYLIEVIAWGNTLFTTMESAFRGCSKLASIPMYDTTNSFADVTTFSYGFRRCTSLKKIPFNYDTNKGLLSGCEKMTNVSALFRECTGLTEPIPEGLIDNCPNITDVSGIFAYSTNLTGSVPNNMFKGLKNLQNASEAFANCSKMNGTISEELFKDCPLVNNIYRIFYGCNQITGRLTQNIIGGLSKLTNLRQAFYNCRSLEGINANAFYNLKSNEINAREAFYGCTSITEIPNGLLESLTGNNLWIERMFANCTGITTISNTCLSALKVGNASGIFGGCTSITSALPTANEDWNSYDTINKWYGAFALCSQMSNYSSIPIELGGDGERKFKQGKVGMIALSDKTFVEIKNYSYQSGKTPIGFVYADVYLDTTKSISTIANANGNVTTQGAANSVHKVFVAMLNDTSKQWTKAQNLCEDITTITNTSDVNVAYKFTRFNGEAYTKAVNEWRVVKGYATKEGEQYTATSSDIYPAFDYIDTYNSGISNKYCFMGDAADLWSQYLLYHLFKKACDKIVANGNGFTSGNCYPIRIGTWYWNSAETSQTNAWYVGTGTCYVNKWGLNKWRSGYVRPSLAFAI